MAIILNDNIKVQAPKPSEFRYFHPDNRPWVSVLEVNTTIPLVERHIGLTVNIDEVEYWFQTSIGDGDLVIKQSEVDLNLQSVTENGNTTNQEVIFQSGIVVDKIVSQPGVSGIELQENVLIFSVKNKLFNTPEDEPEEPRVIATREWVNENIQIPSLEQVIEVNPESIYQPIFLNGINTNVISSLNGDIFEIPQDEFGSVTLATREWVADNSGGGGSVTGTPNKIPRFDGTGVITSGLLTDTGSSVYSTGVSNIIGNTVFGNEALRDNTIGNWNTAFGFNTLKLNTSAFGNTAFGYEALLNNTTGQFNTAIGVGALKANTSPSRNTGIGYETLRDNTTGFSNFAMGFQALVRNTTGNVNTAIGVFALPNNTTASGNVAIGYESMNTNSTGASNTGIGNESLRGNTTGSFNTGIGQGALRSNTTGSDSIGIGFESGRRISSGGAATVVTSSIFIGNGTRPLNNSETNQIVIGHSAIGKGSNTIQFGNSSILDTYLEGRVRLKQYTTATRPTHVVGTVIFDVTINKMLIGGASGWEVVQSI